VLLQVHLDGLDLARWQGRQLALGGRQAQIEPSELLDGGGEQQEGQQEEEQPDDGQQPRPQIWCGGGAARPEPPQLAHCSPARSRAARRPALASIWARAARA
jgi:hypothetical protein